MNRERIAEAIRVMEEVRDGSKPFDMANWFERNSDPSDCGTAACFAGWLTRDPYFQALGLSVKIPAKPSYILGRAPTYRCEIGVAAIAELFDIYVGTAASVVFAEYYYNMIASGDYRKIDVTPDMVIRRLKELLERKD